MQSRDELRKRLREKIKGKRNGDSVQSFARTMKNDPTTAFLQMGVDDTSILQAAPNIVSNPQKMLSQLLMEEETKKTVVEGGEEEEGLPPKRT